MDHKRKYHHNAMQNQNKEPFDQQMLIEPKETDAK